MYQSTVFTLLLQFALFSLAVGAPAGESFVATVHDNSWQYGAGGGVLGFAVLVLDILVWLEVIKSNRPVTHKLAWAVGVFIFPVLGLIVYWLFSNREHHNRSGGYEAIP